MDYQLLEITSEPEEPFIDLMTYRLSEAGFDMFETEGARLKAYCPIQKYDRTACEEIFDECRSLGARVSIREELIPWKNWNEEWEKQFEPEVIGGRIYVRAEFHPPNPGYPLEIIIQPRMAFGTGHHPTTAQMMNMMMDLDFSGKRVIDMGTGTGILAILAARLGATAVLAIDNDANAVGNVADNVLLNRVHGIIGRHGEVESLDNERCDIFLANINRNIILNDLHAYRETLLPGGELLTSGYYLQDHEMIAGQAAKYGLELVEFTTEKDWTCARFRLL